MKNLTFSTDNSVYTFYEKLKSTCEYSLNSGDLFIGSRSCEYGKIENGGIAGNSEIAF